jgi:hypothetical protein
MHKAFNKVFSSSVQKLYIGRSPAVDAQLQLLDLLVLHLKHYDALVPDDDLGQFDSISEDLGLVFVILVAVLTLREAARAV